MTLNIHNWAGNYRYKAQQINYPESIEQLQTAVNQSTHVKALGTRHAFNSIADSPQTLISLGKMATAWQLDKQKQQITVGAQVRYMEKKLAAGPKAAAAD